MRHDYDYQKGLDVGRVSLEMSLKPFKDLSDEGLEKTARVLFEEWKNLLDYASSAAVMFWTADGSEILEYTGDLNQTFNWCSWLGIGNPKRKESEIKTKQEWQYLHIRPFPYQGPGKDHDVTYGDLKRMIAAVKKVGREVTGKDIQVIETFDPGPEFAYSDFKFNRHREISDKGELMGGLWVDCAAHLHAEDHAYAAYPNGIPEGTPFGEFLGKQLVAMNRDLGFDSVWLSNGFGFSLHSWSWKGQLFDGERFDFSGAQSVRDGINEFWKTFTKETGDMLIETRGSNLSTGMDIAAHGCPIDDIYKYNMLTPPNSPWAALDSRFGLELCGYLSHIAHLSDPGFLFRYYTHDPWWQNSPWFDRYGRSPHDIYLPLALARMDADGRITRPYGINFLSADDSFGDLPQKCPNEVIPHILEGYNTYSDEAGILTWLYPFRYYCDLGLKEGHMDRMMMDDWLVEAAIDFGLPVNTVISDENFAKADPKHFQKTILMTPVPQAGSDLEKCVMKAINAGLKIMLYGTTAYASEELKALIGVRCASPLPGQDFIEEDRFVPDEYLRGSLSHHLHHEDLVSGGPIVEEYAGGSEIIASVTAANGEKRPYVTFNRAKNLVWIRGSFPHRLQNDGHLPGLVKPTEKYPCGLLLRQALSLFDYTIRFKAFSPDDKLPLLLFSGVRGGYYQTSFAKSTTVTTILSTPYGAPVPFGREALVEQNTAYAPAQKWQRDELRIFVKQQELSNIVNLSVTPAGMVHDHKYILSGLVDADVTLLAPPDSLACFQIMDADYGKYNCTFENTVEVTQEDDHTFCAHHITGQLAIMWQSKAARQELRDNGYLWPEDRA